MQAIRSASRVVSIPADRRLRSGVFLPPLMLYGTVSVRTGTCLISVEPTARDQDILVALDRCPLTVAAARQDQHCYSSFLTEKLSMCDSWRAPATISLL
jgi:hypothetical protein